MVMVSLSLLKVLPLLRLAVQGHVKFRAAGSKWNCLHHSSPCSALNRRQGEKKPHQLVSEEKAQSVPFRCG